MKQFTFNKKYRFKLFDSVLFKTFMIFFIITSMSIISMGVISVKFSTHHISDLLRKSNMNMLAAKRDLIDQRILEVDKIFQQFIFSSDIWNIVNIKKVENHHVLLFRDIITSFNNSVISNNTIQSIYYFDTQNDFVLSDNKYTKLDFYDQEILGIDFINNTCVLPPRTVNGEKIISYVKKVNSYSKVNQGFFVINLNYTSLFYELLEQNMKYPIETVIFDSNSTLLFSSSINPESEIDIDESVIFEILSNKNDYDIYTVQDQSYFISKANSHFLDWTYSYIQDYQTLAQSVNLVRTLIFYSLTIVLILSLALVYFGSSKLYKPLSNLLKNVKIKTNMYSLTEKNEYKALDSVIQDLSDVKDDLQLKYSLAFPYLQKHSVHDLLTSQKFNDRDFKKILDMLGVSFKYNTQIITVIDFENTGFSDSIKIKTDAFWGNYRNDLAYILSKINTSRVLIIFNTNMDINCIYKLLYELKTMFNNMHIELTISLGNPFTNLNLICTSYMSVLEQLNNKFFIGKNELIYNMHRFNKSKNEFYDSTHEEELINCIRTQNEKSALHILESITQKQLKENENSIDFIKYIYFQLCFKIVNNLVELGIEFSELGVTRFTILNTIQRAETIKCLEDYVKTLIHKSIALIDYQKQRQHKALVYKAIEYITENYTKDISLEQVANSVYLSSRYLSTIFKSETGCTILEYITKQRMEKSRELLRTGHMQIQDIAYTVGYNNVQSFIRFFKKHYNMTPVQYRRANL